MPILTLGFLFRNNQILLAMKKRGFGVGKYNGYGGKLHPGEDTVDGLVREIEEESSLKIGKDACYVLGEIDFYFTDKPEWDQKVFVYRIDDFSGEPEETEEMKPQFFNLEDIPYESMWAGDDAWLPKLIARERFKGKIVFTDMGKKIEEIEGF